MGLAVHSSLVGAGGGGGQKQIRDHLGGSGVGGAEWERVEVTVKKKNYKKRLNKSTTAGCHSSSHNIMKMNKICEGNKK